MAEEREGRGREKWRENGGPRERGGGGGGLGTRASHSVSKIHLLGVYITRQALIYQSKSKNKLILHMHAKIAKRKFSIL